MEALIAVFIFLIINLAIFQIQLQGSRIFQLVSTQSDLRYRAHLAMNFMVNELRQTTRASSGTPPNLTIPPKPNNQAIDFYFPQDLDGNGSIVDALGNTEWDVNNKIEYQYDLNLKRLQRLENGIQYIIANDVAAIEFEDSSINPILYNNELKIILTLTKNAPHNRLISVTLTSRVKLRN